MANKSRSFRSPWRLGILSAILLALPANGVTTSHWVHSNEADFKPGTFQNVVTSNRGELKLSRSVKTLLEQDPKISSVYALAEAKDGTVYAGTGPQGVLLQIKGDKVSTVLQLEDGTNIFSVMIDHTGAVLFGTGGEKGQIYKIDAPGDKPHVIFESEGVQYVFAIVETPDGNLYAATGPDGKLFEITPDGKNSVLLDTDENNLISMISDGKDTLFVGSDPNGLVYKINRKTKESIVLYDAAETEVSALALDAHGNLYVGTAEASDQPASAEDATEKEKIGRPEGTPGGVPIQAEPPANPAPPAVPNPNPGEPNPIPKKMMILADDPAGDPGEKPAPPEPGPGQPNAPADKQQKPVAPPPGSQGINTTGTGQPGAQGNAIYKIDSNGFVTEIFRQPVLIFSIVEHNGVLMVATGSEGLVYEVNPAAEETTVIAKVDPKQVTSLLPTHDGRIIMGLANVGGIAEMGSTFATTGSYTSAVLDATQTSTFGKIHLQGLLPNGGSLKIATRSGNVKEPSNDSWSKWSTTQPATEFVQTESPNARYFQYKLNLTTTVDASPIVQSVDVAYLLPNLPPVIKSVKVTIGGKSSPPPAPAEGEQSAASAIPSGRYQTITWDGSDPNGDVVIYSLYYRTGMSSPWILLKDKLKETNFEWDTRSVADGKYEVKVFGSDAAANPVGQGKSTSRISDPILVDNTPPIVGDLKTEIAGGSVKVSLTAADHTGTVAAVEYAVDSGQDWQLANASDKMFDSPLAPATFKVDGLSPGPHQITVRATDSRGNQGFATVSVTIEPVK